MWYYIPRALPFRHLIKKARCQLLQIANDISSGSGYCNRNQFSLLISGNLLCINSIGKDNRENLKKFLSKQSEDNEIKTMLNHLPYFASGEIVHGFGRGSKDLGIPTANYPLSVVHALPVSFPTGVYYGWANVDNGTVYKMVMSIGWNPYYENKEKSMETHIIHKFDGDLYGCILKICIVGYLRPEKNFKSLDDLITAIHCDIEDAKQLLDNNLRNLELKDAKFFKECNNNTAQSNGHQSNGSDNLENGS